MLHCPYCGTMVKSDEEYCIKCGKHLPSDMNTRTKATNHFNRFWYLPIFISIILLLSLGGYYYTLGNKTSQAKQLYEQGEKYILENNYPKAQDLFNESLKLKSNFKAARISLSFVNKAINIQNELDLASTKRDNLHFQEALSLINTAESSLNNYHGVAATQMINHIIDSRNDIKVDQLSYLLSKSPSINELKNLLWEAETINNNEAEHMTNDIRKQIIDYSYSKASERLNNKQFNDAILFVEDGLKYASDSEKLQSLKTTISKEQTAFEIAEQQRIEQAIHMAAEEYELNTLDAVKLNFIEINRDDQDKLVVKGEVSSVATIPIYSILIEYSLLNDNKNEMLSNKVFVFPDKLYPDETGKFEFTHYDINSDQIDIDVVVNKITWYTD